MRSRGRTVGLVLALGGLLVVLDTTVTVVAVPAIVADLGTTLPVISWATTGYLLGVVAVIPTAGRLCARVGERRVYVAALTAFTICSVLAGLAPTPALLVAARVLQGVAGGLLNPVGQAIGLQAVPREERGRMMSLLGLPVLVGPVLGPPLSGWLVDAVSWRAIFLVNLPVGLLAVVLCLRLVPADPPRTGVPPRLDHLGLALLPAGAVGVVAGATLLGDPGLPTAVAAGVLVVGIGLLAAFVVHARRAVAPLLALRLLRRRTTGAGLGVLALFGAAYFGSVTVLPLIVQGVRGDPATTAGGLGLPAALAVGVTLQVATRLVDRVPPRRIVVAGTGIGAVGLVVLAVATATGAGYPVLVLGTVLLGIGSGGTLSPTMTVALRDLEGPETAEGTTLLALTQQLAAAVGVATVTAALAASFARVVDGGVDAMVHLAPGPRAALSGSLDGAAATGYVVPAVLAVAALVVAVGGLPRADGPRAEVAPDRARR
jgi:EmrB/QacA subfamily drug resistance transporter